MLKNLGIVVNIVVSKLKSKEPAKIRIKSIQVKFYERLAHYISSNRKSNHIHQIHENLEPSVKC